MHQSLSRLAFFKHRHIYDVCKFCSIEDDFPVMKEDTQNLLDQRVITITYDRDPDDEVNVIVLEFNMPEPVEISYDSQTSSAAPLIICPTGHVPYNSEKAIPYKYNATMIENGV